MAYVMDSELRDLIFVECKSMLTVQMRNYFEISVV